MFPLTVPFWPISCEIPLSLERHNHTIQNTAPRLTEAHGHLRVVSPGQAALASEQHSKAEGQLKALTAAPRRRT